MRALILAGGLGTRLREETEFRPKPMVEIGGRPILWHIMKHLSHFGVKDFVIALGYKGNLIREYFQHFNYMDSDFTISTLTNSTTLHDTENLEEWKVTLSETGAITPTGGRVWKTKKYLSGEDAFICTYGDGLSDVNISKLIEFHKSHGKLATVTASQPISRFGRLAIGEDNAVISFEEKGRDLAHVNAGFFIFNCAIFDYLSSESILEREPLETLASEGELIAFRHQGFWQPMDTMREVEYLNQLWEEDSAPWKVWRS